ncbi:MAG: nitroreductase family protein [Candidatus Thermoplasmatota archaeon]
MMKERSIKNCTDITCPSCGSTKVKMIRGEISKTSSLQECSCDACHCDFIISTGSTHIKHEEQHIRDEPSMDAIEALLTRRSIRHFKPGRIKDEDIKCILEAGMSAPSAGNEQPWHFIVIDNVDILNEIPSFHNHAEMLKEASVGILVCNDMNLVRHGEMWIQDCSAATQNILIAIHSRHLGGVWLGVYPRVERMNGLKKLLKIPAHIIPFSLVAIGYPAEHKPYINRYNQSRVHYNTW